MTDSGPDRSSEMLSLSAKQLARACTLWDLPETSTTEPEEVARAINRRIKSPDIYKYLLRLSDDAASVLQSLLEERGQVQAGAIKMLAGKRVSQSSVADAAQELLCCGLVYERRSISNLSANSSRYLLYTDIFERMGKLKIISNDYYQRRRLKHSFADYDWPDDLTVERCRSIFLGDGLELLKEEPQNLDDTGIFFDSGVKLVRVTNVTELNRREINIPPGEARISYGCRFYVLFQRFYLYLSKNHVSVLRDGLLRKADSAAICEGTGLRPEDVDLGRNLLTRGGYLAEESGQLLPSPALERLIAMPLERQVTEMLRTIVENRQLIESLPRMPHRPISEPDIALILQDKASDFETALKDLVYLGFLDSFAVTKFTLYTSGSLFQLERQFNNSTTQDIDFLLAGDLSFNVNFTAISAPDEYTLRIWSESRRTGDMLSGAFTRRSIQDGLYAGQSLDSLTSTLSRLLTTPVPSFYHETIADWISQFRVLRTRQIWVLEGDSDVISHAFHSGSVQSSKPRLLGEHTILLESGALSHGGGLAEEGIYLRRTTES